MKYYCLIMFVFVISNWVVAQSNGIPVDTSQPTIVATFDSLTVRDTTKPNVSNFPMVSSDSAKSSPKLKPKKAKKVKKPFMGGLFIEPEGLYPSPKRALTLSLMLPGGGQIYNKKNAAIWAPFWMIGTGVGITGIVYFRGRYKHYRNEYRLSQWNLPYTLQDIATPAQIQSARDDFRQYSEQAIFVTLGFYLLNGIHAFSQAHLLNFDIDDDLSIQLRPSFQNVGNVGFGASPAVGVSLFFTPH